MKRYLVLALALLASGLTTSADARAGDPYAATDAAAVGLQGGVTGAWDIEINLPDAPLSMYAELTQKDKILTGKIADAQDEVEVTGTIEGNAVKLNFYMRGLVFRLQGELKAETLSGKGTAGSSGEVEWTGKRSQA